MEVVTPEEDEASVVSSVRDLSCSICSLELQSHGENVRAYGEPTEQPILFGDILSLECGHRIHRSCMVSWLNTAPEPSCPMCRKLTKWTPSVEERTNLRSLIQQGWKTLENTERHTIMWTWIAAGIVCLTDPIGYFIISGILMMVTPPMLYTEMAMFLATIRKFIVANVRAGQRIMLAVTIALIITLYVVSIHVSST